MVYVSSASRPLDVRELHELLATCHRNNQRRGVTGQLLYKDGNFMQILEGDEGVVRNLVNKISRDPRNRGLFVVLEQEVPQREFSDWSMSFRMLDPLTARDVPGYAPFQHRPLTAAEFGNKPSEAQQLLRLFRDER